MTRSRMLLALVLGVFSASCAIDLSDDPEVTPPPPGEEPFVEVVMACETALPTPEDSGAYLLGIAPVESVDAVTMVTLAADIEVADDGHFVSLFVQAEDAETGEPCGAEQRFENVAMRPDGTFYIPELVMHVPQEASTQMDHHQSAVVSVKGGFCVEAGSFQGTYEGWTFTPTAAETTGSWFLARPTVLTP